jgi:DNA (cytosine-5)-methyltransferase 1
VKYLSICSGIEVASVAFQPLGWQPLAFSEIEPFPRAILQHHHPDTPLHGDFTTLKDEPWIADADMLCGGTPCQAFSVAGNRQSLADDRGNLTLQFVLLADAIDHLRSTAGREPAWILWENVPGVLSTNDNAFGAFLGGLVGRTAPIPEPADGWTGAGVVDGPTRCAAWRILDAQHFGLAQRRKRVFVLARGGAGRWAVADALLPIIEGSGWHPAPSRAKREGVAPTISARTSGGGGLRTDFDLDGGLIANTLLGKANRSHAADMDTYVAHTLRGEGFDASEEGTGRGIPLVMASLAQGGSEVRENGSPTLTNDHQGPILMRMREGKEGGGKGPLVSQDQSLTLATANDQVLAFQGKASATNSVNPGPVTPTLDKGKADGMCVAFGENQRGELVGGDIVRAMQCAGGKPGQGYPAARIGMQVRRLTPVECERLQGFPDGYTNIPWRGKPESPDGPRYKALGNSWAVPCARYIAQRITLTTP